MSNTEEHRIPPFHCPKCGYLMNKSTDAFSSSVKPTEGDVSMCLMCGNLMLFNADLSVREPTEAERRELSVLPQIVEVDIVRASVISNKRK